MPSPSSMLGVACCPPRQAYSTPIKDGTGGGCKAYGLEDITGVYHRLSRSALAAAQRVSGHGESHAASPDQGACTPQRWRAQSPRRDRPEAGEEGLGGSRHHRQTRQVPVQVVKTSLTLQIAPSERLQEAETVQRHPAGPLRTPL